MNETANQTGSTGMAEEINIENALKLAIRLHQANQFEYAEDVYRKILELTPDDPNVLHFFGLLRHQSGHSEEGANWIKKSLELSSDYLDAQNNLGNIYLQTGHPEQAEPCFRRVIELNPKFVAAYANLGIALKDLERFNEAIEFLLKAIDFEPGDAYHYQNLGNVYQGLKQYREAVDSYRKSLALKPFDAEGYRKLSRTFYIMGEVEHSLDVLKQWLEHDPGNPLALHTYAAYTNTNIPSRASDEYVRQVFDGFAASFDGVLKRLDYKAPFLVQEALQRLVPDPDTWRLLDAGCGTGLCGALVRPLVKHLTGLDLSPKMLERAGARAVYDDLIEAELTSFFAQGQSAFDAITCVDTFCYFGDLSEAMQSAVHALKPGGWFVFTLEKIDESDVDQDYRLNLHGRYSHAETYVRQLLIDAGFRIDAIETDILRKEGAEQVAGLVVTAQLV